MLKVILLRGLPASGKTTWAKQQIREHPGRYARVNRDDLRHMLHNYKFSKVNEKIVTEVRDAAIVAALNAGKNVIVDETSLNPTVEVEIRAAARKANKPFDFEVKEFNKSVNECIRDDADRDRPVGRDVILRMYNQWIKDDCRKVIQNPTKTHALISDLDGTVADMGDRNPYDASTSDKDMPREHVVSLVKMGIESGLYPVFVSGRDDIHEEPTRRWIEEHIGLGNDEYSLFMRKTEDKRDDTIIKEEIFRNFILPNFYVRWVVDDRPKVVRMWRSLGLPVFDVGEGIEF